MVNIAKDLLLLLMFNIFIVLIGIFLHEQEISIASHDFFYFSYNILNSSVSLVIFIAVLFFAVGLVRYITFKLSKGLDQQKQSETKKIIIYAGITTCLAVVVWLAMAFNAPISN